MNEEPFRDLYLQGQLINLKPHAELDWPALGGILNHQPTMSALFPFFKRQQWIREEIEERYKRFQADTDSGKSLSVTARNNVNQQIVGGASLKNIDRQNQEAEFGLIFHQNVWGKGYTQEAFLLLHEYAFTHLDLQRMYYATDEKNFRMQQFFNKYGIRFDGVTSESLLKYELLRNDWPTQKIF